jgi:hypothetical protein
MEIQSESEFAAIAEQLRKYTMQLENASVQFLAKRHNEFMTSLDTDQEPDTLRKRLKANHDLQNKTPADHPAIGALEYVIEAEKRVVEEKLRDARSQAVAEYGDQFNCIHCDGMSTCAPRHARSRTLVCVKCSRSQHVHPTDTAWVIYKGARSVKECVVCERIQTLKDQNDEYVYPTSDSDGAVSSH